MKRYLALLLLVLASLTACTTTHREVVSDSGTMMVASAAKEKGYFDLVARDSSGQVKWAEYDVPNALTQDGESIILNSTFRNDQTYLANGYFLRLYNTTPTATSTLAGLAASEPATANGYSPALQAITRDGTGWPLPAQLIASHMEVTSKQITITATGTVGPVTHAVLATSSDNTGKVIAFAALAATRTLASGDSLQITYKVRLQ